MEHKLTIHPILGWLKMNPVLCQSNMRYVHGYDGIPKCRPQDFAETPSATPRGSKGGGGDFISSDVVCGGLG